MRYTKDNIRLLNEINSLISNATINDVSRYKKLLIQLPEEMQVKIKDAIVIDTGWLMCGADFDSLEDKISALTTKDPNKLRVYEDGFDGHNLRAFSYFSGIMPFIQKQMSELTIKQKFYKLIHSSGKIEYVSERELNARNTKNTSKV